MDHMKLLESILDKLISWPAMMFLTIFVCALIFRTPFRALLDRTIKLKVGKE
jgi:hypothetical protein